MPDLSIRSACPDDLRELSRLRAQIHQLHHEGRPDLFQPVSDAFHAGDEAWLAQEGCLFVVAQLEEHIVAYAVLKARERTANEMLHAVRTLHVEEFCVDESARRTGVGRAFMAQLQGFAHAQGFDRLALDVWDFNTSAKQFYEAMGFRYYRHLLEIDLREDDRI